MEFALIGLGALICLIGGGLIYHSNQAKANAALANIHADVVKTIAAVQAAPAQAQAEVQSVETQVSNAVKSEVAKV
jgi:hypothetical protein